MLISYSPISNLNKVKNMNFPSPCKSVIVRKLMTRVVLLLLLLLTINAFNAHAQQTENEKAVWKLENSYWEFVKAHDLDSYKNLWHENFVGWPSMSSQPVHKDHITDWISAATVKGNHMQWFSLESAASQATENLVVTHYWITSRWVDKSGKGEPTSSRITHTWIKTPTGWQIISGMSSPVPIN
jgi:ketosteroid isomerase-like protein